MNCKNCEISLIKTDEFCKSCGAKVIRNRLTLKNLFLHISETFFNYDNKLLKTILHLFTKPEYVIDSYVNGVRKKYINPISFFGLALTLTGFSIFIIGKFYKPYLNVSEIFGKNEMYSNEFSKNMMENSADFSLEYSSLIFTLMIPSFALISWVVFLNKRYNLTEHIIVYLYSMSLYSILSILFGFIILIVAPEKYLAFGMYMYLFVFIYHCYLLTRLFKLNILQLFLKIFLFFLIFFVLYIAIIILVFIALAVTGIID